MGAERFDPTHPGFLADPYPALAWLRDHEPISPRPEWGYRVVTRYADVRGMLRDRRFVRGGPDREADPRTTAYPQFARYVLGSFMEQDGEPHARLRGLVATAFTRRRIEALRSELVGLADRLLDRALEQGHVDVVTDYARPIAIAAIADLMGIPAGDRDRLVAWSQDIVRLFELDPTEAVGADAERATTEFAAYLAALIRHRTEHPQDDLLSGLVIARHEGARLAPDDVVATAILLLNAGHEATVHAIGNAVAQLLGEPAARRTLATRPELFPTAIEELLRIDPPLQLFHRWTAVDVEWNGTALPAGTKVALMLGAANRDPAVFTDPDRLHVDRSPNPHIAFGAGAHFCIGAPLARLEMEVALDQLLTRASQLRALPGGRRLPTFVFRGWAHLPVQLDAGV